uniref:Zinc finger protein ZAT4 n=2 Tax=Elaeis guineensis var. tenera TaxID=51953 RepID=A0A6I9RXJ9_ELAGV|nr:zinc finger protein ZAT4 [Elaeis guineensis]
MAMVMDQQQQQQQQPQQQPQVVYKHYCRVCKKGFGCGRALGGHMRAHGINDDTLGSHADPDDDPPSSEWDDKLNPPGGHKRMYALRTNPNRLKSCRVCENCGKEFLSWKSFLEHGKCSAGEDAGDDSLASSPRSDADADDPVPGCAGWSKGKRSRRAKAVVPLCPSSEEEDLANCLVMLSAARVDPMVIVEPEESCASASKEEDRRQHPITITATTTDRSKAPAPPSPAVPRGMFECKACKKVFTSHQALGGHRASHKKVKGCFAAKLDDLDEVPPDDEVINHDNNNTSSEMAMAIVPFDNPPLAVTPLKKKSKVHECSICHRVFTSGQALGGHKRCHWITSNAPDAGAVAKLHPLPPEHATVGLHPRLTLRPMFESSDTLDLNLPAPVDQEDLAAVRKEVVSPLLLDMPAALYLKPWIGQSNTNMDKNKASSSSNNNINNNNVNSSRDHNDEAITNGSVDEEADSKVKLAKLSDLKDINMGRESSPWLQVGIGSSTNEDSEP